MAEAPAADITTTPELIRTLLREAAVPQSELPLTLASSGWDNDVWRLGDDLAVRVPRRDFAADLIRHEQLSLPVIARALAPTGVLVPEPVVAGAASELFSYAWSIVPWFRGTTALDVPRGERTPWAGQLADALARLHQPAPAWAPKNPHRGVPFAERDEVITQRMQTLRLEPSAQQAWRDAVAAPPHAGAPVWIHGDLHPDNIVIDEGALHALIDFGDVTSGDPAYDLAVAWLVFDAEGRAVFQAASPHVDDATWIRARGWATAIAAMLLEFSDDKPRYRALAAETLAEV